MQRRMALMQLVAEHTHLMHQITKQLMVELGRADAPSSTTPARRERLAEALRPGERR